MTGVEDVTQIAEEINLWIIRLATPPVRHKITSIYLDEDDNVEDEDWTHTDVFFQHSTRLRTLRLGGHSAAMSALLLVFRTALVLAAMNYTSWVNHLLFCSIIFRKSETYIWATVLQFAQNTSPIIQQHIPHLKKASFGYTGDIQDVFDLASHCDNIVAISFNIKRTSKRRTFGRACLVPN